MKHHAAPELLISHSQILLSALTVSILLALPGSSSAEIVSGDLTGGQAEIDGGSFDPPLTDPVGAITANGFDDDDIHSFDEAQDLILPSNIILDVVPVGVIGHVIGAGSLVSSHYVVFDPAANKDAIGSVTFDEPVLGVITKNATQDDTNATLGNPTASYSVNLQSLDSNDSVSISGSTVFFDVQANSPGDAFRVVTGTAPLLGFNECDPGDVTMSATITGGDAAAAGAVFRQICDPIGDVGDDNFETFDLLGFEEQQAVFLTAPLNLDTTSFIPAGETVSSYYLVFDPYNLEDIQATVTFSDTIIGVIDKQAQLADSDFLGDASANYLNPSQRGLETGDTFSVAGADLTIDFTAGTPGDVVRIILGSASSSLNANPCDPGDETLSGTVTAGQAATDGGQFVQLCNPIGAVGNDNYQSDDLHAFEELQHVVLAQPLDTDEGPMATVPAGTVVSSYYVAFDPGSSKDLIGSVTFPGPILGVMTGVQTLTASDGLGNPSGNYLNPSLRGLEGGVDSVSVMGDTLTIDFTANSPGDYVRVLVEPIASVPAADPWGLLAAMILLGTAGGWRLRRAASRGA